MPSKLERPSKTRFRPSKSRFKGETELLWKWAALLGRLLGRIKVRTETSTSCPWRVCPAQEQFSSTSWPVKREICNCVKAEQPDFSLDPQLLGQSSASERHTVSFTSQV